MTLGKDAVSFVGTHRQTILDHPHLLPTASCPPTTVLSLFRGMNIIGLTFIGLRVEGGNDEEEKSQHSQAALHPSGGSPAAEARWDQGLPGSLAL